MYQEMYQEAWERRKGVVEKLRQQLTDVEERASRVRSRWNEQWSQVQVEKKRIEWVIESLESKIKGQHQMQEDQQSFKDLQQYTLGQSEADIKQLLVLQ